VTRANNAGPSLSVLTAKSTRLCHGFGTVDFSMTGYDRPRFTIGRPAYLPNPGLGMNVAATVSSAFLISAFDGCGNCVDGKNVASAVRPG
jgi:hypothetical protein